MTSIDENAARARTSLRRATENEARAREVERKNRLAAHISTVTRAPVMSGERITSMDTVEFMHRETERDFLRSFGVTMDDEMRDTDIVSVPVRIVREKARLHANSVIREAAETQRLSDLRAELLADNADRYELLLKRLVAILENGGRDIEQTTLGVSKAIVERVR